MRFFVVLLVWLPVASIFAQDTTTATSGSASNPNPIVSLASEFFEHDYFNLYGFANGVYDSYAPIVQNGQTVNNGGAFGYAVGGGINAVHSFHDGSLSLSYSGDYRDYQSSFFSSGTDQNLVFGLTKRITRRWSFSVSTAGGVIF